MQELMENKSRLPATLKGKTENRMAGILCAMDKWENEWEGNRFFSKFMIPKLKKMLSDIMKRDENSRMKIGREY